MEARKTARACNLGVPCGLGKCFKSECNPAHGDRHIPSSDRVNPDLRYLTKSQKRKHSSGHSKKAATRFHQAPSQHTFIQHAASDHTKKKTNIIPTVFKLQLKRKASFKTGKVSTRNQLHFIKSKNSLNRIFYAEQTNVQTYHNQGKE